MRNVAVLIPAYDAASTIRRAVASALAQSRAAEVVVVDDGSSDATARAARRADDGSGRLRVIRRENRGPAAAINVAHAETSAEYVCVLDADDFFLPNRLERIFSEADGPWDMAADRLLLAQEGHEDGPWRPWGGVLPASGCVDFEWFVSGNITDPRRQRTELGYLQPVFRRAFVDHHGLMYDERLRLGEDYVFYARALAAGAVFKVIEAAGYVAVSRATSLSHVHSARDLEALYEADMELARLPLLSASQRQAVRRHAASVHRKWLYHLALETKAAGDLATALAVVASDFGALRYAMRETVRARWTRGPHSTAPAS